MHILENNYLKIKAKKEGAELTSIQKKETNAEYLWQADPTYWGRHAPVLFPIVGRLKEDAYTIAGKKFSMKQHGLARNLTFSLLKQDPYSITFELNSDKTTLKQYPFPFRLHIQYALKEKDLIVFYRVINPAKEALYFSIGGHPAFNCPLKKGEKRSDYQLFFDKKETASTQRLTAGIRNGSQIPILKGNKKLPITDDLFAEDALVFQHLNSDKVSLQKGTKKILSFEFKGFPYLGIWSQSEGSPFVCIEPWYGVADKLEHNQKLQDKEGIIRLEGKSSFDCYYVITIH